MTQLSFTCHSDAYGATIRLMEKSWVSRARAVPVDEWPSRMANQAFAGISRLFALLDEADRSADRKDDGVFIDHATIASLTEPQALGLGFPPSVPAALQVETKNLITDTD